MAALFKIPAMFIYFVGGLWGLAVSLGIVYHGLGLIGTILGLLVFPLVLYLAPWYAGFAQGNWFPVVLVYGSGIVAMILFVIGSAFDKR
jgi:hypothetical protein